MSVSVLRWLPLALIALAAFWLRTHDLDRRPMHADEANQAVKTGHLLETGFYAFDPHDHHGPTLYYAALPIAWLRGERSLATLTETTVRLVPAIAGTIAVVLLGLLAAAPLGRWSAAGAAAFLAVAPPAVYYSRYFVQETLLLTFALAAFFCIQQWWRRGTLRWAISAGSAIGLMLATKSSTPLFLVAGGVALLATRASNPASTQHPRAIAAALLAALIVAIIFYSSFGTHLAGLRDSLAVFGFAVDRATGESGHEKPWWYYFRLFGWHREGGLLWQQIALSALAFVGLLAAVVRRNPFLRGAAIYTAMVAIVLSVTPYKTPWHAIHLVPGLSLLAAGALDLLPRRWLGVAIALVVLVFQARQTRLVAFLRPADARNPYAYVHSSPDVLKFRALADAALARVPGGVVRVISEEYWPLPWYLRGLAQVGYWTSPPAECDGALVIASANQVDAVRSRLHGQYKERILGLRPGFLCVVFTPEP
jgi:uncharacterized protein (TIGR03663 family)